MGLPFRRTQLHYDPDGVPILSALRIEDISTEVLQKHCRAVLQSPEMTPVLQIIETLGQSTGLQSAMQDLGFKGRAKILGRLNFSTKLLILDTALTDERHMQMRFTAGHEIGHWILHRWNYKNWKFQTGTKEDLEDDEETICRLDERTPQDWLEWQANVFAASLVMPRATFRKALVETQTAFGITKNVGVVWMTDTEYSQRDFKQVGNRLANIYGVSLTSIRVRLKTLQLLHDVDGKTTRSAAAIFRDKPSE